MASVVAFDGRPRELSESEALEWLRQQPRASAPANNTALAECWGWSRERVSRCLRTWQAAGLVTRSGKRLTVTVRDDEPVARRAAAVVARQALVSVDPPAEPAPEVSATPAVSMIVPPVAPAARPAASRPIAAIIAATALSLSAVGLVLNAQFAASLGQTGLAAVLLAAIGVAMDILAVTLPTAASRLWQLRHPFAAGAAWLLWVGALAMMMLAGIGFASTNIGDAVAGRAKVVGASLALGTRLDQLREERGAIHEQRGVAMLEAELQRVQPSAQAVWKATGGCHDVTLARSGQACEGVLRVREAIATAQRRDSIDTEMRDVERQLAALPAVRLDDPQARTTSDLVSWASGGLLAPSAEDIHRLRVVGLTVAPACAGLLLWMAVALWRRQQHGPSRATVMPS
jgi:Crp-like helix-turn-helix domain